MRMAGNGKVWRRGLAGGVASLAVLSVAAVSGCGPRDAVDTPVNWWHQLEGGEIALQRPPPPGVDDPYPKVGTTPAKAPVLLSPQLRASLTEHLEEQRNLSARLNAHEPVPAPVLPPARPAVTPPVAPAAPNPALSSATLDAAEAPPPTTQPATPPLMAMPAVAQDQTIASGPLPPIPNAPPPAPGLPGIAMPPPPSYTPPSHPDYALADTPGEALRFEQGSDALATGQDGTLRALAARRKSGIVYVHGFGDAASDTPADQAQALVLASLRARTVAGMLQKDGVPTSAIRLRADAFGRGAVAGLID
jgi:hypothetical protein